jgi:hypothetical protein
MDGEFRLGWCRSCNEPIIWARTVERKLIPVDVHPSRVGNILLVPRRNWPPMAEVRAPGSVAGKLRTPHHMTCPQGSEWRSR